MKYQLRMYYADALNQTAGSKATRDCSEILSELGYRHFDVPVYSNRNRLWNLCTLVKHVFELYRLLKPGDQVLLQYPLLGINQWLRYLVALLRRKGCRMICLLHDLDSLRQVHHAWTLEQEVSRLEAFDLLIVHNERMKALLQAQGLKLEMRTLDLFDYLVPERVWQAMAQGQGTAVSNLKIAFAGNLGKSVFLQQLDQLPGISFRLYGPGYETLPARPGMEWAGSFDADELPAKLDAAFGLIWDGDTIDGCTGYMGTYLQYNNPHKASLYLLAGLPLIAPEQSAIGDFIRREGVGVTINDLRELPELLEHLTQADYLRMKAATVPIARALASGSFLKQALEGE